MQMRVGKRAALQLAEATPSANRIRSDLDLGLIGFKQNRGGNQRNRTTFGMMSSSFASILRATERMQYRHASTP